MIQNYKEIDSRIKIFNSFLKKNSNDLNTFPIQKIFSCSKYIFMSIRLPGKTIFLALGRGSNHEGLYLTNKNIPAQFRIRDRYLEYLRKYLVGARIQKISMDTLDRILFIEYYKSKSPCLFSLFYCGRNLYFINIFKDQSGEYRLFLSWELVRDNKIEVNDFSDMKKSCLAFFDSVGRLKISNDKKDDKIENLTLEEEYFNNHYKGLLKKLKPKTFTKRKKKFYQKKEIRIIGDLKKVKAWRELKQLIETDDFKLPSEFKFTLLEHKFKILPSLNYHKRLNEVYVKIKKLKKAEEILTARLSETKIECKNWIDGTSETVYSHEKILCPVWYGTKHKNTRKNVESSLKYNIKEFETIDNIKVIIGMDASANDYIRSKRSHKDDMWFHLEGMKSAHLIAKIKSFSDIKPEHFTLFGSMIRDITGVEVLELPLVYTQVKNIKGMKGNKGSVTLKKQKYLVTLYDKMWNKKVTEI